jgi:GT2 family glycosyltransferase
MEATIMSDLTVIIPSRTMSNLLPCLEALRQRDDCNVIVVWDRSNGNDWSPPQSHAYTVKEIYWDFVYARNCNIGMLAARENDVILLNDDALLETAWGFTSMQQAARDNPEYGVIGAVTNVTGQPLQRPQGRGLREVPHFAFVCVLIPQKTIRAVGLLDERYCLDYGVEDRDYCEQVRRKGLKCGVFDDCFVDHSKLRSTFRGQPLASRSYARNWQLYLDKWSLSA